MQKEKVFRNFKRMKNYFVTKILFEKSERMYELVGEIGLTKECFFVLCARFKKYRRIRQIVDRRQWHKIKRRIGTENEEKLWWIEAYWRVFYRQCDALTIVMKHMGEFVQNGVMHSRKQIFSGQLALFDEVECHSLIGRFFC